MGQDVLGAQVLLDDVGRVRLGDVVVLRLRDLEPAVLVAFLRPGAELLELLDVALHRLLILGPVRTEPTVAAVQGGQNAEFELARPAKHAHQVGRIVEHALVLGPGRVGLDHGIDLAGQFGIVPPEPIQGSGPDLAGGLQVEQVTNHANVDIGLQQGLEGLVPLLDELVAAHGFGALVGQGGRLRGGRPGRLAGCRGQLLVLVVGLDQAIDERPARLHVADDRGEGGLALVRRQAHRRKNLRASDVGPGQRLAGGVIGFPGFPLVPRRPGHLDLQPITPDRPPDQVALAPRVHALLENLHDPLGQIQLAGLPGIVNFEQQAMPATQVDARLEPLARRVDEPH